MTVQLRRATSADVGALYGVCLRTGADGSDASSMHADPDLLGHVFLGPYLQIEPNLAFVVADDSGPVGYIVGAADTIAFAAACEQRWFPALRDRYRVPHQQHTPADVRIIELLRRGVDVSDATAEHPAHLHINLEPAAQGSGWGRRLIERFEDELVDRGVAGFHLGVSATNAGAIAFYERLGLDRRPGASDTIVFTRSVKP